ncbi:MAG TPA: ABC transporter substrate-binding protein, partial [Armatimonadota bacterium]|nr:ABC transporter substrate-binding protein [Armatimonadota bacterium]
PRVMYEIDASDPSKPYVAGGRGVYGELLPLAGGRNIFQDSPLPAAQVSTESVVARDPQVILLGDSQVPLNPQRPDTVRRRPGWQGIAAVRSGRIYPVAAERMTRPGPRLVDGVEEVARLLHPERFR